MRKFIVFGSLLTLDNHIHFSDFQQTFVSESINSSLLLKLHDMLGKERFLVSKSKSGKVKGFINQNSS